MMLSALIILSIAILGQAAPSHAATFTVTVNGIAYQVDDETMTATATGYAHSSGPAVNIPEAIALPDARSATVTAIGTDAFKAKQLTSVTIPETVTSIGESAFSDNRLSTVSIPDSVTTMGRFAFSNNLLRSAAISNSITSIASSVFRDNQMTSVTIPASVTSIGNSAFSGNQLTSVTIPDAVTVIDNYAFRNNRLTSVTLSQSLTHVETGAFQGNRLVSLTIPASIKEIGLAAFAGNPTLASIRFAGPPPTRFTPGVAGQATTGSFGDPAKGLVITYREEFAAPEFGSSRFTSPIWRGYQARAGLTVSFDSQHGSAVAPVTVDWGGTVNPPSENPTRTGHTFTGWHTDQSATIPYVFTTPVQSDLTLYAGWSINLHTISFDGNGGSPNTQEIIEWGKPVGEPGVVPSREGHTFTGWFTDRETTARYAFTTPIRGDLTLYAGWSINTYTTTFDTKDGSAVTAVTTNWGDPVAEPDEPTRDGHTFTGWHSDPDATSTYDFASPVSADQTLYAGWKINTHTVTFDGNGGSTADPVTTDWGTLVSAPSDDPTREGHEFSGWHTDPAATVAYDFDTPVSGDLTLYAGWKQIVEVGGTAPTEGSKLEQGSRLPDTGGDPIHWPLLTAGLLIAAGAGIALTRRAAGTLR